jgi:hypothetical protein
MKRLEECLNNQYANYVIPFFWQHGESHAELLSEIEAIRKSGAMEFCVESRVYEDFCGKSWWEDFGFILEEAKKRKMRVWLLDDKRFPTGYANGMLKNRDELKKKHIRLDYVDVVGPKSENAILIKGIDKDEKLISVTAYQRSGKGEEVEGDGVDLTQNINDELIFWDIPKGVWRVYFVIETRRTTQGFAEHIDILNPDSCKLQLQAVYEPQYEHFKEYFGNVFAGFFSDEPSFGNDSLHYDSKLGKKEMLIPWNAEIVELLASKMEISPQKVKTLLPFLWEEHSLLKFNIRFSYMDLVSNIYKENFSDLLGDWCREHGVMYIGHVIEDMNAHMRLGYGAGHFFRALSGQDMAGCDIVLNQMIPGIKEMHHTASVFDRCVDPEFFSYTLAKLASSSAHIDPKKKNRAFCEIFGAFGWVEGVPMMKQLVDHMLVSGINYFVPHAFNAKYPDYDCPPHFYIGGRNPQFEHFCSLTQYMQRMCHVLSEGVHHTNVAVLYNAEAEWCAGEYDLFQKVSKILLQNQIDFDFIPSDCLINANIVDNNLVINEEKYKVLVVSYSEVLPQKLIDNLNNISKCGIEVIFCESLPKRTAENKSAIISNAFTVQKTKDLPNYLEKIGCRDIKLSEKCPYLRYYHLKNNGKDMYMFLNEDIFNGIDVVCNLTHSGQYIKYNAWDNSLSYGQTHNNQLSLKLKPSEVTVIIFEEHNEEVENEDCIREEIITPLWKIYVEKDGAYQLYDETDKLYNLARKLTRYAGKIKYECCLNLDTIPIEIELGNVGEIATMWINGKKCADAINYPYSFKVKELLSKGENDIVIEVITNLAYRERDDFSKFLSLPPIGIVGPVKLRFENANGRE